jgi:hypothetical protein
VTNQQSRLLGRPEIRLPGRSRHVRVRRDLAAYDRRKHADFTNTWLVDG